MSALPSTADIHQRGGYVSFVLITDTSANTSMPRKPRRELAVSRGRKHPRLAVAKYVPSPTCMMICPRLSLLSATSRCKAVTRAMLKRLMRNGAIGWSFRSRLGSYLFKETPSSMRNHQAPFPAMSKPRKLRPTYKLPIRHKQKQLLNRLYRN
jgi:hypothetical protein